MCNFVGSIARRERRLTFLVQSGRNVGRTTVSHRHPKSIGSSLTESRYFHPVSIGDLGTLQDGGMGYNNPTEIALEECARVWRSKPRRDLILSFGTGTTTDVASPSTPARGWLADWMPFRVARWSRSGLGKILDPQIVHRRVKHTLYSHDRPSFDRYFRLNLDLPGPLPRMDDVSSMASLIAEARERRHDPVFTRIKLVMIASSFFFELDRTPTRASSGRRLCVGSIRIRGDPARVLGLLPLDRSTRMRFVKDDEDLAVGHPTEWLCPSCGRFDLPVRFRVSNTIDPVAISLRLGQDSGHHISGFPREPRWFVEQQQLDDVFFAHPSPADDCVCRAKAKPGAGSGRRKRPASGRIGPPRTKRRRAS